MGFFESSVIYVIKTKAFYEAVEDESRQIILVRRQNWPREKME
jgi:hypothetical protein